MLFGILKLGLLFLRDFLLSVLEAISFAVNYSLYSFWASSAESIHVQVVINEPVSPYPVMKISCQIVQSYLVQFFLFGLRLDFVLFGFTIEILRYLDSVGLCWTRVGFGSNIPNHYLT